MERDWKRSTVYIWNMRININLKHIENEKWDFFWRFSNTLKDLTVSMYWMVYWWFIDVVHKVFTLDLAPITQKSSFLQLTAEHPSENYNRDSLGGGCFGQTLADECEHHFSSAASSLLLSFVFLLTDFEAPLYWKGRLCKMRFLSSSSSNFNRKVVKKNYHRRREKITIPLMFKTLL